MVLPHFHGNDLRHSRDCHHLHLHCHVRGVHRESKRHHRCAAEVALQLHHITQHHSRSFPSNLH